ncbi:MAG TPA: chemotaxis protein CheB [Frateuria sp.]|uniref:chemotaxis protein CheB n=1 Tax=Frateuria sp. TaxID=2211372 RepID=UPI002DE7DF36|nr:chemotaxis protein CheB [Frateuria sp.]
MAEAVPAVALLFDDAGLGEQLRSALQERGARIVHEGPLSGLSRELLFSVNADVLVVNLDDEDDGALERLDETLAGDRPRVVFNDGQASRGLEGWDRARWARHLAMKVLAMGDADPPRPPAEDAAPLEASAPLAAMTEPEPLAAVEDLAPQPEEARQAAASETLAAELEALLASDVAVAEADEFGSGLNYAAGEGMALHEDVFAAPMEEPADAAAPSPEVAVASAVALDVIHAPVVESPELAVIQRDHLQFAVEDEAAIPAATRLAAEPAAASRVSDSWTLYDHDADPAVPADSAVPVERADPADFGIEKLSAADYLAPDAADDGESPILPGLSLELVSMEEAIAPQDFERGHEMVLELPDSAVTRLVVLGATTESTASVGEFLAALPAGLRVTVLHTQHLAGRPADGLAEYFASLCPLPVRVAEAGMRARVGEVIVVPSDRQVTLRRNGSVELQPVEMDAAHAPSIDASFTQAAAVFGRDVIAIVFAGRSTDAVGGCQAVHDRGGQVWVEASGGAQAADMVSGVLAEHLSHHAGTPRELAARLAEQFPEGQP